MSPRKQESGSSPKPRSSSLAKRKLSTKKHDRYSTLEPYVDPKPKGKKIHDQDQRLQELAEQTELIKPIWDEIGAFDLDRIHDQIVFQRKSLMFQQNSKESMKTDLIFDAHNKT